MNNKITSIWEDDDFFEVKIITSNGDFSGGAKCYAQGYTQKYNKV